MNNYGVLTLIPAPLSEDGVLEPKAFALLNERATNFLETSVFVIEDLKPGRRRWLSFGLPRSAVDHFYLYNEHTAKTAAPELLQFLKSGKNVYLMSDGGLPAFYDPGRELVDLCHRNKVRVTSTPFFNSVALSVALSGFSHQKFWFEGFLPIDQDQRKKALMNLLAMKHTSILMDTPYRLKRVLEELDSLWSGQRKQVFLACDLNQESELLLRGSPREIMAQMTDFKREFVLLLSE